MNGSLAKNSTLCFPPDTTSMEEMHPDLSLSLCCSWHFCTTGTKNTVFANWRPSILAFCGICMKGSGRGRFDHHQSTGVSNAWGKEEAGPGNQKCCEFTKNCKLGLSRSCRAQVPKCLKCPIFFSRLIFILDIFSGHLYFLAHNKVIAWIIQGNLDFQHSFCFTKHHQWCS